VTAYVPDDRERQRYREADVIKAKCPGWFVMYGPYSRLFWAFGSPDGRPIGARSASELLGCMRAAERSGLSRTTSKDRPPATEADIP
jgi:hypothetical protein